MILALESSSSVGSVALIRDGAVVREESRATPRGRGAALPAMVEEALRDAPALSRVVVGLGPGSYNGIRGALALGWGIARGRHVPLVGVSSLLGLAGGAYCAVGDARRAQYYFAVVRDGAFQHEPALFDEAALRGQLALCSGLPIYVPGEIPFLPGAQVRSPRAARLAALGAGISPSDELPEPLYLKPAYINLPPA